jgi:hypothetical protein
MRRLTSFVLSWLLISVGIAQALTVDEIIKLKQAGVGDATIQQLIESEGTSRAAGVWRTKDGWIVHTTETRAPHFLPSGEIRTDYPFTLYPWIHWGRR